MGEAAGRRRPVGEDDDVRAPLAELVLRLVLAAEEAPVLDELHGVHQAAGRVLARDVEEDDDGPLVGVQDVVGRMLSALPPSKMLHRFRPSHACAQSQEKGLAGAPLRLHHPDDGAARGRRLLHLLPQLRLPRPRRLPLPLLAPGPKVALVGKSGGGALHAVGVAAVRRRVAGRVSLGHVQGVQDLRLGGFRGDLGDEVVDAGPVDFAPPQVPTRSNRSPPLLQYLSLAASGFLATSRCTPSPTSRLTAVKYLNVLKEAKPSPTSLPTTAK